MLKIKRVLKCVRHPSSCFTFINVKDAYSFVPIIPKHRKFLCFSFKEVPFQKNVYPFAFFGSLHILQVYGNIRVLFYVDDLTVMAPSRESLGLHTAIVVKNLSLLGFCNELGEELFSPLSPLTVDNLSRGANDIRVRLTWPGLMLFVTHLARQSGVGTVISVSPSCLVVREDRD